MADQEDLLKLLQVEVLKRNPINKYESAMPQGSNEQLARKIEKFDLYHVNALRRLRVDLVSALKGSAWPPSGQCKCHRQ